MEEFTSVWNYQENLNELKKKLIYITYELESTRTDAKKEIRKYQEYTKQLLQLLNAAYRERDEARDQLQRLLSKVVPNSTTDILSSRSEGPSLTNKRANSSFAESDSLSEAYNHHSFGSSLVDSSVDPVSSPEMSNMNAVDSSNLTKAYQPIIQESSVPKSVGNLTSGNVSASIGIISSGEHKVNIASSVIDKLIEGRPLPSKGRLLQAVIEAGPLLQTLLLAGPLPQWQNPPPLQPFQVPVVSIKGCDPENVNQYQVPHSNFVAQGSLASSYLGMSSQIHSTSALNFLCSSGSCLSPVLNQDLPLRDRSSRR